MFNSEGTRITRVPSLHRVLVSACGRRHSLSPEAIVTVDRAVASGSERHGRVLAAVGADDRVHFPWAPVITAAAALGALCLSAGRTALGFVLVTPFGVVCLIISAESKRLAALHAGEGSVLVTQ